MKGKMDKMMGRPSILYCIEAVALRQRQETKLEVAEVKMLRFSVGVMRTVHVRCFGEKVRGRPKRRFVDVVKEDMKLAGVREEDVEDRGRWKQMLHCGDFDGNCEKEKRICLNLSNMHIYV